jgi:hypothetical protein
MAQFTIQADVEQAATTAFQSGLLMSLCTIQVPDGSQGPSGNPTNTWITWNGMPVGIVCMDAVTANSVQATEAKAIAEIESKAFRHVLLSGCYPQLFALKNSGEQVRALITDASGATTTYEVLGVEDDSQATQTRFECQKVDL